MRKASIWLLMAMLSGCEDPGGTEVVSPSDSPPMSSVRPMFTDVTTGSGLAGVLMQSGGTPSTRIIEVKGGGLALLDIDNDGDLDLFMPNGATLDAPDAGPGARLFRNLGGAADGIRFEEVTESGDLAEHRAWSFGVAAGDVDGNGFDDLVVSTLYANRLYLNEGDGRFVDATAEWGLNEHEEWSTSVGLADLDGDADLDLYVVNYLDFDPSAPPVTSSFKGVEVLGGPRGMAPTRDRIYENTGARLVDRSDEVLAAVPARYGLNLAVLDLDGDDRLDIYVGNDSQPNFLLQNNGHWEFKDVGVTSGSATNLEGDPQATMGIAVGDVDGNGRPDIYSTNFSSDTNTLHANLDGVFFDDRTGRFGLREGTRTMLGWAAEFGDFDHDGDEDLVVFNGHVYPQATPEIMDSAYAQPPQFWLREGDGFRLVGDAGLGGPRRDRTAVVADLDLDGDLDIVAGELNGELRVYRNTHDGDRDFLVIEPRPAQGAMVEISMRNAEGLDLRQRRWIRGGGPFQSTAAPYAHFGIPPDFTVEDVTVRWPDGRGLRQTVPRSGVRLVISSEDAESGG